MADIGDLLIPVAKDFSVLPVIGTIVALAILALAYGLKGKDVGEAGWRPAEWWGLSMQSSAAISQRT
jgi:hypothetical protein